ncbi:MAG: hydrogenase nickel incorporation protein HypB [Deltaproteobacteria bacterium]|nr:hydrogenase nickel incorporation protein HypB [Deltaproteobacteria bacterium]
MCDTCGCGMPSHEHAHEYESDHDGHVIELEMNVLAKNDVYAAANREHLASRGAVAINMISSPGAGKTTLLQQSLNQLKDWRPLAVVEGDLQTDNDARRIQGVGVPVHQINTNNGCHLDAHMVGHAYEHLSLATGSLVFIENVGNLVCPAGFDLGENATVVLLSVTEGDDKPAKYPVAFVNAQVMVITKTDLLPYVDFSMDRCKEFARAVNPDLEIIECSSRTGDGMDGWVAWVKRLANQVAS